MEEQKKAKQVSMNPAKDNQEEKTQQKLSYEDLNKACADLFQQNQHLKEQLNKMYMQMNQIQDNIRGLEYSFLVLDHKDCFDEDFVKACADRIQYALYSAMTEGEEENNTETKKDAD
jgi:hypothetical protein